MSIFVVVYPFGTDKSYEEFTSLDEAKVFIDEETNRTNIYLPDEALMLYEFENFNASDIRSLKRDGIEIYNQDDNEEYIVIPFDDAIRSEEVSYWKLSETEDGKWESEDGEIYDTEEEGVKNESPSQYMVNF